MKKYLLLTVLCLTVEICFAQRKQVTEDYYKQPIEIAFSTMPGKLTYGYIVGEDGEAIKDGAYSIKCTLTDYRAQTVPYSIIFNGSFTLNTTFSNGRLNGALSSNYRLDVAALGKKDRISSSITGSFRNGVPNGTFKVTRNGELITTLTANYKNGVLVGAYSCSLLDDRSLPVKYSGTLTQDGKFTGEWNLNGRTAEFQNGVLISEKYNNKSTKPALVELAKKYASKAVGKEALEEKNIIVKVDSIALGDYVCTAVFRDSGVEFKKLGGYDFSLSDYVKYEQIEELVVLTDAGADILAGQVIEMAIGKPRSEPDICYGYDYYYTQKCPCIRYDKKYDRYYIEMNKNDQSSYMNKQYVTGSFDSYSGYVYITPKQMSRIEEQFDIAMKEHALPLKEVAVCLESKYPACVNYLRRSEEGGGRTEPSGAGICKDGFRGILL